MVKNNWRETNVPPEGYAIVPPDGKWGWVVLAGCLICGFVAVALTTTFSVIMNKLIEEFQTNVATISWVTSVLAGISGIIGPFCTVMVSLSSCRRTVIVGGLFCSAGLILSSLANRVEVLILTFGVLAGIGSCLTFLPLHLILACYFRKYYGITMGLLFSGCAVSKVATTPIVQLLFDNYGWRGTLLITGGFMLNIIVGGILFQPPKWHAVLVPIDTAPKAADDSNDSESDAKRALKEAPAVGTTDKETEFKIELEKKIAKRVSLLRSTSGPTDNQESDPMTSQMNLSRRLSTTIVGSVLELNGPLCAEVLKLPVDEREEPNNNKSSLREKFVQSIDISLFKEHTFYVVIVHYSLLLCTMAYSSFFLYAFGIGAGLRPMEAAGLVSVRSVGEIIGRSAGPLTLAAFRLPTIPSFIIAISLSAALFLIASFMKTLISLYTVCGISGVIFGSAVGMNSVILMEIMGATRLPSVIGICTFFQGFVVLLMGPVIGWVRDVTGTFASCFILLGCIQLLIALLWSLKLFQDKRTHQIKGTQRH